MPARRETYFHEDDYCQQQLLPRAASADAIAELKEASAFSAEHRAPGGMGWTDLYVIKEMPAEFETLKVSKTELCDVVSAVLPPFDVVYTGYGSHRDRCENTAAWGKSGRCTLFASWNDAGFVKAVWSAFFDRDEESISTAATVVGAIAQLRSLIYVDWAWEYICDASDEKVFAAMLRTKLESIANGS